MPRPRSAYMRQFLIALVAKLSAFVLAFTPDEIERLGRIAPGFLARVREATEQLAQLIAMPPAELAGWVRERLPELEARFAS